MREPYLRWPNRGNTRKRLEMVVGQSVGLSPDLSRLRTTFLFGETFCTFTDLLKYQFKLLQFFWRDILEGTFDDCRVPAKERDKHLPAFFSQRHGSDPTISAALYATDKPLLVQTIHRDAD